MATENDTSDVMAMIVIKGDKGFTLAFTINDSSGTALNLSTVTTITFKMKTLNALTNKVSGACTVVDAPTGQCSYTVGTTDMDTIGTYKAELLLTYTSPAKTVTVDLEDIMVIEDLV